MFERYKEFIQSTKPLRIIKRMPADLLNSLTGKWSDVRFEYGVPALAAAIAVPLKLLLFYKLIGIAANFFLVWLITCVLTYLLFASFKNKWIPAAVYLLLSVLMFCDLTYSSFFNRYLSVNMLGAVGVLGDITGSIKEVIKPWFFLILADAVLALGALAMRRRSTPSRRRRRQAAPTVEPSGTFTETPAVEPSGTTAQALLEEAPAEGPVIKSAGTSGQAMKYLLAAKGIVLVGVSGHKKQVTALILLCLLVFNSSASYLITSLSNQEIYSYHIKDVINKITGNSVLDKDSGYMYAIEDSYEKEKEGPLFGVAKGKNLIVIQIESLQNLVINKTYNGQELTPNLNEIIKGNTVYFDRYYQQIGSGNTSDAEFATNNSIYGSISSYTYKLFADNYFRGLPVLLKEQGYETAVFHAHEDRTFWNREEAYKSLGFDTFYGGIGGTDIGQFDMTEWMGWGLTDSEFFKQAITYLKELTRPFYSFIITLSNHHPYLMLDKYRFIKLLPEDEGTIFGNYLNSAAYTDWALGQLMQELKDAGIYDDSIIAFYGDHQGLPKTDEEIFESVSRFLGKDYDFDTMMNIPLIITVPGAEQDIHQTVSTVGGQLDFMPTVAYLMGFDSLDTVYLGHNLLTVDSGFVAEQTYMVKGSFFSDDAAYEMSRDGVFENGRAWDPKTGETLPVKDCYKGYLKSVGLINTCEYILKNDVLRKIYEENKDAVSVFYDSPAAEQNDTDE
ncbi:MAG TPA: LTA synthase family protein [Anaerovoracaceae bacterium]|nr:LTA synthase family protein [Anaerovoracaceae bacterium]